MTIPPRRSRPRQRKNADRPGDVLEWRHAHVVKRHRQAVHDVIANRGGDHHLPGLRRLVDARGDVDAMAAENPAIIDDVLDVDADAKAQRRGIAVIANPPLRPLDLNGPAHSVDGAGELDHQGVAGHVHDPAIVAGHVRLHDLRLQCFPATDGFGFVVVHQPRKLGYIGERDGGQPPVKVRRAATPHLLCKFGLIHLKTHRRK